jgi:hypothetical protein
MDGIEGDDVKCSRPGSERQMLHVFSLDPKDKHTQLYIHL